MQAQTERADAVFLSSKINSFVLFKKKKKKKVLGKTQPVFPDLE